MIIDSSALLAILRAEPDASTYAEAIESAARRRISAANFLETAIVIDGSRDPIASRRFDELLREAEVLIEPVTEEQAKLAREAYRDFGKGSGHAAQLNFGDCFAYALAKCSGEPLLFKGNDFTHTDITQALEADRDRKEIDKALDSIRELRKRTGKIASGELLSARDEGRKS